MPDKDERDRHGSGTSSNTSSSSSVSQLDPPDGGWGWVVVFASFTCHLIADGNAFSFGVFYVELLDYFEDSKGKTALVGSLFMSVPLITGPIASAITNKYGCRATTIMGGFIAGCGFVMSGFTSNIEMLCFTYGVIAGFGLSMVYVPAVIVVAFYFERKRAFATGIAVAGSGIGTFVFAPLTEFLIHQYTWRGALIVIGGLMFNIMAAGMAFRPLTTPKLERKRRKYLENLGRFSQIGSHHASLQKPGSVNCRVECETTQLTNTENEEAELRTVLNQPVTHSLMQFPTFMQQELKPLCLKELQNLKRNPQESKTLREVLRKHGLLEKFVTYHSASEVETINNVQRAPSVSHIHESHTQEPGNSDMDLVVAEVQSINKLPSGVLHQTESSFLRNQTSDGDKHQETNGDAAKENIFFKKQLHKSITSKVQLELDQLLPLSRKDIFYRGSIPRSIELKVSLHSASCPSIVMHYKSDSKNAHKKHKFFFLSAREVKGFIRKMMNLTILRSIVFQYFCLSSFLLYFAYDVPYVFTVDKAIEMNISEAKASFLVSIIGITSTVGQILIGWLGDFPQVKATHLYTVLTTIAGLLTIAVPWIKTYALLATYCALFGVLISANYSLTTIILVQLLGMDKLTNAYGIVMLFEGLGNLSGPPAAGFLSDKTGSYFLTFVIFGIVMMLSGFMLIALPCLNHLEKAIDTGCHGDMVGDGEEDMTTGDSVVVEECADDDDGERQIGPWTRLKFPQSAAQSRQGSSHCNSEQSFNTHRLHINKSEVTTTESVT